jgi:hypothetical protein
MPSNVKASTAVSGSLPAEFRLTHPETALADQIELKSTPPKIAEKPLCIKYLSQVRSHYSGQQ